MRCSRVPSGVTPDEELKELRKLMDECSRVDRMSLREFKVIIALTFVGACYEVFRGETVEAVPMVAVLLLAAYGHRIVKRDEDERLVRDVMEG